MAEKVPNIYQLQITLLQVKPKIWRRILVPENFTFWDLRVITEDVMKLSVSKFHYFQAKDPKTGRLQCISFRWVDCSCPFVNGSKAFVRDYLASPQDNVIFDQPKYGHWAFNIELEQISPEIPGSKYPRCIGGERAAPPSYSKNVLHFQQFLKAFDETRAENERKRNVAIKFFAKSNFNWKEYHPEIFNSDLIQLRYMGYGKPTRQLT